MQKYKDVGIIRIIILRLKGISFRNLLLVLIRNIDNIINRNNKYSLIFITYY
jgi:hypothetical protein